MDIMAEISEMSVTSESSKHPTEQVQLWRSSKVSLHETDNKLCQMNDHCIR